MDKVIEIIVDRIQDYPIVAGINGMDCSGKTTYAKELYDRLDRLNINAALLHIDDYNNLEVQKVIYDAHQKGDFTGDLLNLFYQNSIHYGRVANAITMARQKYDVTLIEGVFLYKECLASLLDIKIFLPVEAAIARARYVKRKQLDGDSRPTFVLDDIWLPAFERYVREVRPEEMSDFIVA